MIGMQMNTRAWVRVALAILFALLCLNAWSQVVLALVGRADDPPILIGLQCLSGGTAAAAAVGSWVGARWASVGALLYGVVTGAMIAALEAILHLGNEARVGLWVGGAAVLIVGAGAAWYLRRDANRPASASAQSTA